MPSKAEIEAYLQKHSFEESIQTALSEVVKEMPPDPLQVLADKLAAMASAGVEPVAKETLAKFCAFGPDCANYATEDCLANPPGAPPMPIGMVLGMMAAMKGGPFPGWESKYLEDSTYPKKNADGTYSALTWQCPGPMKGDFPELGPFPFVAFDSVPGVMKTEALANPVEVGTFTLTDDKTKVKSMAYSIASHEGHTMLGKGSPSVEAVWGKKGDGSDVGFGAYFSLMGVSLPPPPAAAPKPTAADMEKAKLLYVQLKMDYTKNPDMPNLDALKYVLGDMGATMQWAALPGLRHKYFIYDSTEDVCCGVYVFYTEKALNDYMASELFKAQGEYPHVSKVTAEVKDVMPGTELAIEQTAWASTPPTREDVVKAKMLIVDIEMNYATGVEGLPTKKEELYGFMAAPPNGMGYPGQFGPLEGLRGKYFAYDAAIDHCYGFYTFVDQASLDKYMASDLFKLQGDPPHIKALTYKVCDVLPGTEKSIDLGTWGSS